MKSILTDGAAVGLTLAFVWNRNPDKLKGSVPDELILTDLSSFASRCSKHTPEKNKPTRTTKHHIFYVLPILAYDSVFYRPCDVIVEVCHPRIVKEFGILFLSQSHFMVRLRFCFAVVLLLIINMSVIVILCQSQNVGKGSKDIKHPCSRHFEHGSMYLKILIYARLLQFVLQINNFTSVVLYHDKVGSPSALSDSDLNQKLREAAQKSGKTLYIPSGALWGGQDIQRLNDSGALKVIIALIAWTNK